MGEQGCSEVSDFDQHPVRDPGLPSATKRLPSAQAFHLHHAGDARPAILRGYLAKMEVHVHAGAYLSKGHHAKPEIGTQRQHTPCSLSV